MDAFFLTKPPPHSSAMFAAMAMRIPAPNIPKGKRTFSYPREMVWGSIQ